MNLQEKNYDAFISYRHSELDRFVAETLHKELEAFKLPKVIAKQLIEKGNSKTRIERVFRDRDELPITNNLADPITNALQNSDHLLVICSPRLKESLWCRKEIETFISMHGRERVFAVLIEGEPQDSFPEELLYEEKRYTDANGEECIERVPIEPLAADVRGNSKCEIRKKIKEEVLRLAAPMFDCSYDDIKQRHRERMLKRVIAIASSVSAVFAAFGIVSSVMAYQIKQQSVKIQEQSVQIQEQADELNIQYQEALKANAKQMAEDSFSLIERGDLDAAADMAYQALSDGMPYTAEAEYALASSLQLYSNGYRIAPSRLLKQESEISFCHTSPDTTKLLVVDVFGNLSIYDPLTGEEIFHKFLGMTYLNEGEVIFLNNHAIVYPLEDGFAVYDLDTDTERCVKSTKPSYITADKNARYLLALRFDGVHVYNVDTLEEVFEIQKTDDIKFCNLADFSTGSRALLAVEYLQDDYTGVYLIDLESDTVNTYLTDKNNITSILAEDEYVYMTTYSGITTSEGAVYCIATDGSFIWKYEVEGVPDILRTYGAAANDKLSFITYGKIYLLNKEDGTELNYSHCGNEIVNYGLYTGSDNITYMTRNGDYHYVFYNENTDMIISGKFTANSQNLKDFEYAIDYYASVAHRDNVVAIYETMIGPDVDLVMDIGESPLQTLISKDSNYMLCYIQDWPEEKIAVIDIEKKEVIREIIPKGIIYDIAVTDSNELVVLQKSAIEVYNIENGELLFERETETDNEILLRHGEAYAAYMDTEYNLYDTYSGEIIRSLEGNLYDTDKQILISALDPSGDWYAYSEEMNNQIVVGFYEKGDVQTFDLNVKTIESILLAAGSKDIYLTYLDGKTEVYDIETGELIYTYDKIDGEVVGVIELPEIQKTILLTDEKDYLLNENNEIIACLEGFEGYRNKTGSFLISAIGNIYEVPYYSTEEIVRKMQ